MTGLDLVLVGFLVLVVGAFVVRGWFRVRR